MFFLRKTHENFIKMDELGVPLCRESSKWNILGHPMQVTSSRAGAIETQLRQQIGEFSQAHGMQRYIMMRMMYQWELHRIAMFYNAILGIPGS